MNIPGKLYSAIFIVLILLFSCVSIEKQTTTWQDYMADTIGEEPLELHYEAYGQGNPIIFLHGLGGTLYTWRHLVGPLAPHYRLILFDLKGAGKSPKPFDDKYSMFDQAELIYRFIRQNDMRDVTLVRTFLRRRRGFAGGPEIKPTKSLKIIPTDSYRYGLLSPEVARGYQNAKNAVGGMAGTLSYSGQDQSPKHDGIDVL